MLELDSVTRKFEKTVAVDKLSLQLKDREFLVIFGPAGAGKSTTLRLIAGIIQPTRGDIICNGHSLKDVPPENRNMSMVFENYALYSHMSVYENMAFPLRSKKITQTEVDKRIKDMAEILQIGELMDRKPGFLSGGQRQRVALGRALIREADVYLLDEPISHLDAKLRHHMRAEIKAMCSERGATVVYVTHDYKEAMALSDRIVVLNKGKAMQIGTPDLVYHRPESEFVGSFLGDPSMSFLDGVLKEEIGNYFIEVNELHIPVSRATGDKVNSMTRNGKVRIGVRASELGLNSKPDSTHKTTAEVYVVETFGYRNIVSCQLKGAGLVQSIVTPDVKINIHETVFLNLSEKNIHLFVQDGADIIHPIDFKNGQQGAGNVIH